MKPPVFPISALIPQVLDVLRQHSRLVLEAPPGAGKTTQVPLALLDAPWLQGRKIILLEPRRVAARSAALFMARQLGEDVGGTVGYRIRFENRISSRTRIEVVTEGILTRMLQDDPMLEEVGAILFDEFHERHLSGDLGLALALDVQAQLRDDLRLVVMSATLDGERLARFLDAPRLSSEGRSYPVAISHFPARRDETLNCRCAAPYSRPWPSIRVTCWCSCPASARSRGCKRACRNRWMPAWRCWPCTVNCRWNSRRAYCRRPAMGAAAWCWPPTSPSRR